MNTFQHAAKTKMQSCYFAIFFAFSPLFLGDRVEGRGRGVRNAIMEIGPSSIVVLLSSPFSSPQLSPLLSLSERGKTLTKKRFVPLSPCSNRFIPKVVCNCYPEGGQMFWYLYLDGCLKRFEYDICLLPYIYKLRIAFSDILGRSEFEYITHRRWPCPRSLMRW